MLLASPCIDIVVSETLKPYFLFVDGLEESTEIKTKLFILSEKPPEHLRRLLNKEECAYTLAVGYESFKFLCSIKGKKLFYSMVLFPSTDPCFSKFSCGISLNIGVNTIAEALRLLDRGNNLAIVFSSPSISFYVKDISMKLIKMGVNTTIVKISQAEEIRLLPKLTKKADVVLFVPDRVFAYEDVVKHAVAVLRASGKAVIGFNRLFLKYGASLILSADYKATGKVAGEMIKEFISTGVCRKREAVYKCVRQ